MYSDQKHMAYIIRAGGQSLLSRVHQPDAFGIGSDWLIFSSPYGQTNENAPCGSSKYGNNYDCICKAPGENLLISNQIHIYTDDTYNSN